MTRERWSQRALLAEARTGYLKFDWPKPVHAAAKGYEGSGGAWRFVWRTSMDTMATLNTIPGLERWRYRYVLYVGRSDGGFTAIRIRRRWHRLARDVNEIWRTPLDTAVVTARTFGHYSVVEFGARPVWVVTSEIDSLLGLVS